MNTAEWKQMKFIINNGLINSEYDKLFNKYTVSGTKKDLNKLLKVQNKLLDQHMKQNGEGFIDDTKQFIKKKTEDIKAILFGRERLEPNSRAVYDKYKDEYITSITLTRSPVASFVKKFLDIILKITGSSLEDLLNKYNYDDVMHLDSNMTIGKKKLSLGKEETIKLRDRSIKAREYFKIDLKGKKITLGEYLKNIEKRMGQEAFYGYNAKSNNCQDFQLNALVSNGLLTPEAKSFILEQANNIYKELPEFVEVLSKAATDLADKANIAIQGSSKQRPLRVKKDLVQLVPPIQPMKRNYKMVGGAIPPNLVNEIHFLLGQLQALQPTQQTNLYIVTLMFLLGNQQTTPNNSMLQNTINDIKSYLGYRQKN